MFIDEYKQNSMNNKNKKDQILSNSVIKGLFTLDGNETIKLQLLS